MEIGHLRLPGSLMMVANSNLSGAPAEHVGERPGPVTQAALVSGQEGVART